MTYLFVVEGAGIVEFGVFQGADVGPPPWNESEPKRLREDVQMGVLAEEAGFGYFWSPEHHFLEQYSHNSSSHLSCLAVGMLTSRIRVGTGIFNICPPINNPIRVAEQIATIDILTNGRVEFGTGRGSGSTEVNGFGVFNDESREMWEEAIQVIPKMWTQDLFSWDGKYFSMPERDVLPKPVQKPHPPMWVTATSPATVERAAQLGLGVAMFNFSDPAKLEPLVKKYKRTIQNAEPVGEFVNDRIMTLSRLLCLEDGDLARREFSSRADETAAGFQVYFDTVPANAERVAGVTFPVPQTTLRQWLAEVRAVGPDMGPEMDSPMYRRSTGEVFSPGLLRQQGISVGDPDDVLATVRRFEAAGFDQLCLIPRPGHTQSFEQTTESMRTFGRHVLPHFVA